jgi:hypothetical protein
MWLFTTIAPVFSWLLGMLFPGRNATILHTESKNKANIMTLVNGQASYVDEKFSTSVPKMVEQAYALGQFPALWAIEGIGKDIAEWHMKRNPKVANIMQEIELDPKWDGAWLMLHAGQGMAFAKYFVDRMKTRSDEEIKHAVESAVDLCRNNSRPGYFGAAMESLGLVSRFMGDGAYCRKVDAVLRSYAPDCVGYFWRGAGRALYFHPVNFFPGMGNKPSRAIANSEIEGPHEEAVKNLKAGIAWALTVVNMVTPEVMEWVLKNQSEYFGDSPSFTNGMMSSVVMRYDTSPQLPTVKEFMNYRPQDPQVAALWKTYVTTTLEDAINRVHPVLKKHHRLDEVFHYTPLLQLASDLESGKA